MATRRLGKTARERKPQGSFKFSKDKNLICVHLPIEKSRRKERGRWKRRNTQGAIKLHASPSCSSKASESILNRKIQKYLSTSDLLSDRQNGFHKWNSTGDLLTLPTDSWSSCLSCLSKTVSVALDIAKAFDRVWHKSLLSKLVSFGIYSSLSSLISCFLSGGSISAMVDGHCSSSKLINSGIPQGSALSPTLFLLFINDLLTITTVLSTHMLMTPLYITRYILTEDPSYRTYKTPGRRQQNA